MAAGLQHRISTEGQATAIISQRRQFAHNREQAKLHHDLGIDIKFWPLSMSPSALSQRMSVNSPRPLLALFVPPPELRGTPSAQRYATALKEFSSKHLGGVSGGVLFQTGLWMSGRELDDAAVALLENQLPNQPMVLLSYALLPGNHVQPRFAYLAGASGSTLGVQALCSEPIAMSSLLRGSERALADRHRDIERELREIGYSPAKIDSVLGTRTSRTRVLRDAEEALAAAGRDPTILEQLYSTGDAGIGKAERGLIQALKVALLIASDGHNLLTRGVPPKLPMLLPELRADMPQAVLESLVGAVDGYEKLFEFPSFSALPVVLIARERLEQARSELTGSPPRTDVATGFWAESKGLAMPRSPDAVLEMFHTHAAAVDAGFVETLAISLETRGDLDRAGRYHDLAASLRSPRDVAMSTTKREGTDRHG